MKKITKTKLPTNPGNYQLALYDDSKYITNDNMFWYFESGYIDMPTIKLYKFVVINPNEYYNNYIYNNYTFVCSYIVDGQTLIIYMEDNKEENKI